MEKRRFSELWSAASLTAWLGLILSALVTYGLWDNARENAIGDAREHFDIKVSETTRSIRDRMLAYENSLHSGVALFKTVDRMTWDKWHRYLVNLDTAKFYPGFQGIGYAKHLAPETREAFVAKMRSEERFSDYTIKPSGERSDYYPIMYLEPLDERNLRAVGYDMFSDAIRREAMVRARDSGQTALSGKVTLVQENDTDVQAGFLMYVPFYRTPAETAEQRRERIEGFVYAPFRAGDLMEEILGHERPDIALTLYDGPAMMRENLLFDSTPETTEPPLFESVQRLDLYGQTWTIRFQTLPLFAEWIDDTQARLVVFAGIPISLLLFLTIFSFSQSSERAHRMARRMTREIRALNDELETMIGTVPSPIILHTETGKIVKLNRAWTEATGYTLEDIPTIDRLIETLYRHSPGAIEEVKRHVRSLYDIVGKVDEGEFTFSAKSGQKMTWQFSSAPFGIIKGERAVITSAMDITELKKKDELMLFQSRHAAMGEMISMIAHQWRQPLASISTIAGTMNMEVLLDEYDPTRFEEQLHAITDLAVDLSETINDFRGFFKEDREKERVSWGELVESCMVIIDPILRGKGIAVEVSGDMAHPFTAYSRKIKQAILNLLKNAEDILVDHSVSEPTIWIRAGVEGERTFLTIEDNGGGIPQEIIPKIFDPYFSTKMDKDGTGIGLYMSKKIVEEQSGGRLQVENGSNGACFTIVLPLDADRQV